MTDPTSVYPGECDKCRCTVRDNERSLFPWGRLSVCADCYDDLAQEAEDEARQEAEEALSGHDRDSWFRFAADIALAPFNGRA